MFNISVNADFDIAVPAADKLIEANYYWRFL